MMLKESNTMSRHFPSILQHCSYLQKTLIVIVFLLTLSARLASTGAQHDKLKRVPSKVRVQGCYIVYIYPGKVLWEEAEGLMQNLEELNEDANYPSFSAQIVGKMRKVVFGFAAKLSPVALEYVLNSSIVSFIEEDQVVQIGQHHQNQPTPQVVNRTVTSWGIDRIDQVENNLDHRYNPPCNLTGRGVDVYVLDTGIFYEHEHFQQRALFSGCDMIDELGTTTDFSNNQNGADCNGHGTAVTGVIGGSKNGIASGANLLSVRVISCDGRSNVTSVLKGLECVYNRTRRYRNNPAVINLSIYGSKNAALKRAIDNLIKHGITVVALSGNSDRNKSGNSCKISPSSVHGVLTVAATTDDDFAYERTNMGQCVDILAPGKGVTTALWHRSGQPCTSCEVITSGSSLAAPHVTGAIALLLEKCPRLTPWEVKHHLLRSMTLMNRVNMNLIPRRLKVKTPNLLLHVGPSMCSIEC